MYSRIANVLILILLTSSLMAQKKTYDYATQWKKIEDLVSVKGQPLSALKLVDSVYAQAKKENNDAQLLKALVYKTQINSSRDMSALKIDIASLEKELIGAKEPRTSLLHSLIASNYWQYFQQNRYKLYDRKTVQGKKSADLDTWSASDLHGVISEHYLASLKQRVTLSTQKLADLEPIIVKGDARKLRPTLYDLVAQVALDYFTNDERTIQKPVSAFQLTDPSAYAPADGFTKHVFTSTDSSDLSWKALLIYQDLTRLHLSDTDPTALINLELERLAYVDRIMAASEKKDHYSKALTALASRYPGRADAAMATFRNLQLNNANTYGRNRGMVSPEDRFILADLRKKFLELETAFPGSPVADLCFNERQTIEQPILKIQTESVNLPGKPFRALVQFQNVRTLHFRIIKLEPKEMHGFGEDNEIHSAKYWSRLLKRPAMLERSLDLPQAGDYRLHSVEIKLDELPLGQYALLVSSGTEFAQGKEVMGLTRFHVTSIAWFNNREHYFFVDRETGRPLPQASVQVWRLKYQYDDRKREAVKSMLLKADLDGHVRMPSFDRNEGTVLLEVDHGPDHYFPGQDQYSYESISPEDDDDGEIYEEDNRAIHFFLDRSIYRPGQILYFKGLVVTKDSSTRLPKIQPGFRTTVRLRNSNNQHLDSLVLVTNEYGTISGRFTIPTNQETGEFSLTTDEMNEDISFRVEEYKRPKFHTEFEPIKGEFRLNDSISLTGLAKAYAGNAVNGAKVEYRVIRKLRYNPYGYWGPMRWRGSSEQEIAYGNTVTEGDGRYRITFKALPDMLIPESENPLFEYSVSADVTDLNGETRSASQDMTIGYRSLQLNIGFPENTSLLYVDSTLRVIVQASNMSGQKQALPYTLTMKRLESPDHLIRKRYWEAPDTFLIPREDYRKWFPYDEYANESKPEAWKPGPTILSIKDKTGSAQVALSAPSLMAGWYLLEATALDGEGKEVRAKSYVQINDRHDLGASARESHFLSVPEKWILKQGESTRITLVSNAEELWVLQERMNGRERIVVKPLAPAGKPSTTKKKKPSAITSEETDAQHPFTVLKLTKGVTTMDVTAAEGDRGGFGMSYAFVSHNRFFSTQTLIGVPWTEKELDVTFKTYRDKTEPGSAEKWTVSVKGKTGDRIAAEMLASSYDMSLDQFNPHAWQTPALFPIFSTGPRWSGSTGYWLAENESKGKPFEFRNVTMPAFEALIWQQHQLIALESNMLSAVARSSGELEDVVVTGYGPTTKRSLTGSVTSVSIAQAAPMAAPQPEDKAKESNPSAPISSIRTNFNETAFFYPDLHTDADGNVQFSFTMPEALTQWKTQVFAHTKDLAMGMATQTFITQKDLMVQPNAPRFLREGDRISFAAKVANMAEKEITGQAQLQLIDPETNEPVDGWFKNTFPVQFFTVAAGQSSAVKFEFEVPTNYNKPLRYRIVATSGNKSDGEEAELPVLSNRMLITESMPILMKGDGTKTFSFEKLLKNGSPSLTHHALTVEYSANPAWYAVQSLPYLAEFPHECAEQLFNRFYANALAEKVLEKAPKIKAYYEQWAKDTTKNRGLISNLEKNPELKSVLLQETPWVMEAKNEADQKKNIAILFDLARINRELGSNLDRLKKAQSPNGGFTWFPGGPDDRFITQYIASSIGHLKTLQAVPAEHKSAIDEMQRKAIIYLDQRIKEDYEWLIRNKVDMKKHQLSNLQIQYLYARSMAIGMIFEEKCKTAYDYFIGQATKYWVQHGRMEQGMIALVLARGGDRETAKDIMTSLKQYALQSPTLGMYWANNSYGYYWHDAPVETQALMIEAFAEVTHDEASVESMKQWLLTQKQTSNWKSTKATADAVYALLLQGQQWTAATPDVTIKLGDKGQQVVKSSPTDEAGTGYFKQVIEGKKVTEDLGKVEVTVQHTAAKQALSWGSVYWQYFENLDAITPAASPFSIKKGLFLEKNTDKGPVNVPVENGAELKPGDKLIVRIEIRADRDMEYVHLKDMRASGTEPVNVLSEYKWQGGLGYYESTRDASTNFFFASMPKGTYVFEYPLFVSAEGNFSVGIAQAECMYAPEFSAHSQGLRIRVRE